MADRTSMRLVDTYRTPSTHELNRGSRNMKNVRQCSVRRVKFYHSQLGKLRWDTAIPARSGLQRMRQVLLYRTVHQCVRAAKLQPRMASAHRSFVSSACPRVAAGRVPRCQPPVRDIAAHGKRGLQALQELEVDRAEEQVLVGAATGTCRARLSWLQRTTPRACTAFSGG